MLKVFALCFLTIFIIACSDSPASKATSTMISLSWSSPTQDTEDNQISEDEIIAYSIHYGQESGQYTESVYIENPQSNSFVLSNLPEGAYYFSMKAIINTGEESDLSEEFYIDTQG